jgi:hypothetical protein
VQLPSSLPAETHGFESSPISSLPSFRGLDCVERDAALAEFSHGGAKYWLCPWTSAMSKTAKGLTAGVVLSALWLVLAVSTHNSVPSICLVLAAIWLGISDWIAGRNRFRMTIREQFEQNRRGWPQPLPRVANVMQGAAYFLGAAALVYWIAM